MLLETTENTELEWRQLDRAAVHPDLTTCLVDGHRLIETQLGGDEPGKPAVDGVRGSELRTAWATYGPIDATNSCSDGLNSGRPASRRTTSDAQHEPSVVKVARSSGPNLNGRRISR